MSPEKRAALQEQHRIIQERYHADLSSLPGEGGRWYLENVSVLDRLVGRTSLNVTGGHWMQWQFALFGDE
jgi:hypothetical protein